MSIRDLILTRDKSTKPSMMQHPEGNPLTTFHRQVDQLFESLFDDFGLPAPWRRGAASTVWESAWPAINMAENDHEIVVTAELPGLEEKDVTVELEGSVLSLRGEIETEQEDQGRRWSRIERTSGSFHRVIELPSAVREEEIKATFKRGVLTITLPKAEPDTSSRKVIPIE